MARVKTKFCCQECGYESAGWLGRCPGCGAWNTMVEEVEAQIEPGRAVDEAKPLPIDRIPAGSGERLPSGLAEFDRVLGGEIGRAHV